MTPRRTQYILARKIPAIHLLFVTILKFLRRHDGRGQEFPPPLASKKSFLRVARLGLRYIGNEFFIFVGSFKFLKWIDYLTGDF
jgi:hypothetical protein